MDYYYKYQLQIIETGKNFEKIAGFETPEHAIKFADSLLPETTTDQFLIILGMTTSIAYIKQGLKKVKKLAIK